MAGDEIPSKMIIRKAQAYYLVEFNSLDKMAIAVAHSNHGSFLKSYADAWLRADVPNKRLMKPVWLVLIDKYSLDKDLEELPT